ncbi:MAG: glycosyltransferase [Lachnospiraceae bacterium]|nr:glycosyltransferase [Lachnospiraceae bacterium]
MEILFYRYNSICEPDILQAFTGFGITVHTEELEMHNKQVSPRECAEKVSGWILAHPLAFVFSINFFPAVSYTCEKWKVPYVCWSVDSPVPELFSNALKNTYNRIFLFDKAQYNFFSPINPDCIYHLPLATNVKRWEKAVLDMTDADYGAYGADVSFVGSLYTEKSRYDSLPGLQEACTTDRAHRKENSELRPAGGISPHTRGFVDGLMEAQLQVFGCNFIPESLTDEVVREIAEADPGFYRSDDVYTDMSRYLVAHQYIGMKLAAVERERTLNRLSEHFDVTLYTRSDASRLPKVHCKGGVSTLTEMPKVFQASKINLNMTMRPIETGLSLRIWDILGCGGFLLTNYQSEIPDYFEIGRDLETYESMEELEEKVRYYLAHDEERVEIAISGYEKVAKYHTYEVRLAQMIRILTDTMD